MLFLLLLLISTHSDSIKDWILYPLREGGEGRAEGSGEEGGRRRMECMAMLGFRIWRQGFHDEDFQLCRSASLPAWELKAGRSYHAALCPVRFEIISDRLPKQLVPHFSSFYTSWSLIYKIDHSLQWSRLVSDLPKLSYEENSFQKCEAFPNPPPPVSFPFAYMAQSGQLGGSNDYCSIWTLSLACSFMDLFFIACKAIVFTWNVCLLVLSVF